MIKRLKFHEVKNVERTGILMLVQFLDDQNNPYEWAPKWADVESIFIKAIDVERFNKPESRFLNQFASTAQNVVEGAQRINQSRKDYGLFDEYKDEKLVLSSYQDYVELTPAFDVTVQFLDKWLGKNVCAFVVNDLAICLREYGNNNQIVGEYPPPQEEDLPW